MPSDRTLLGSNRLHLVSSVLLSVLINRVYLYSWIPSKAAWIHIFLFPLLEREKKLNLSPKSDQSEQSVQPQFIFKYYDASVLK